MKKLKHTPGPWVTYDDDITQVIASDKDRTLRMGCIFHDSKNLDVVQANARLIAAAPEMLEALVYLLKVTDPYRTGGMQHQREAISMSIAVIEKATGMKFGEKPEK